MSRSEQHTAIQMQPTVPQQAGGGHWQDGRMRGERGWSEVEEKERRQAREAEERERERGPYGGKLGDVAGESTQSFARLPLEGSEVGGVDYRQGSGEGYNRR